MKVPMSILAMGLLSFGMGSAALAAALPTPGQVAAIAPKEGAVLDVGSITRYGPEARFDVKVGAASAQSLAQVTPRRIRYVADCAAGKIAPTSVTVGATSGTPEVVMAPPGSAQWIKPEPNSQEADWLAASCQG